ncbi:MAG: AmmeMemoRadiSam system protein B [Planctomycetota bacterium]
MSDDQAPTPPQPTPPPPFDPEAAHQQRPRLRPVRGFAAPAQGPDGNQIQVMGLADAKQISPKVVFTQPAMQAVIPHLTGEKGLDEIVTEVGRGLQRPMLEAFVAQLDDAGLIEGPTFDAMWDKMKADFDSAEELPPAQTAAIADMLVEQAVQQAESRSATNEEKAEQGGPKLAQQLETWMDQTLSEAEDPSFESLPRAIVVPSVPYGNGWRAYSVVYGRMRVVDTPKRILILGTNHFGMGTGVVGCDKGFRTPVGRSPLDTEMADALRNSLGDKLFEHRYDHEREHSIELQCGWLQKVFGGDDGTSPPIFAALVHDPVVNEGKAYDGEGIGLDEFVEAAKSAIGSLEGPTLVVASAEMSHVGPSYGDQVQLAGDSQEADQNRRKVLEQDHQLLKSLVEGKPQDLIASLAWQQNPTRWSSTGALAAASMIVGSPEAKLLNIGAVMDAQGSAMITAPAMAML